MQRLAKVLCSAYCRLSSMELCGRRQGPVLSFYAFSAALFLQCFVEIVGKKIGLQ